jgi:hypothetical protein
MECLVWKYEKMKNTLIIIVLIIVAVVVAIYLKALCFSHVLLCEKDVYNVLRKRFLIQ